MSFDLQKVLESKRAMRRSLAAQSVEVKLRMLDELREREIVIRNSVTRANSCAVREAPAAYLKRPL